MVGKIQFSRLTVRDVIRYAQYFGVIPMFLVFLHGTLCLPEYHAALELKSQALSLSAYYQIFIDKAELMEFLSLAYIFTILIVSSIYTIALIVPAIGVFFGLNDPVIAVSFAVFVACVVYDLINDLDFSATKFGIGLFTGTLVKEKFKSLQSNGEGK